MDESLEKLPKIICYHGSLERALAPIVYEVKSVQNEKFLISMPKLMSSFPEAKLAIGLTANEFLIAYAVMRESEMNSLKRLYSSNDLSLLVGRQMIVWAMRPHIDEAIQAISPLE